MVLLLKDKQKIVMEIHHIALRSVSAVFVDPTGLSVNLITELRSLARSMNVYVKLIRNALLRLIVVGTDFDLLKDRFIGANLVLFSMNQACDAPRICENFAKKNDIFLIKYAMFEGRFYSGHEINLLSSLPTYGESVLQFVFVLKEISIGKLLRVLFLLSKM